jgi:hypothetical protein
MEHIMKASAGRKLQPYIHLVDELRHLVRPDVPRLELPYCGAWKGCCCPLSKAKKSPIANLEGHWSMVLVVDALLNRLCLFKAIVDVVEESCTFFHLLGNRCDTGLVGLIRADGRGVPAIDHTKRRVAERGLVGGVVCVLRPWQPTKPLPGTVAGEASQVHDDDSVGSLSLAVRLRVKGGRHVELHPSEPHELLPERRGEHWIAVRDNGLWKPMEAHDVGEEGVRDRLGGVGVC